MLKTATIVAALGALFVATMGAQSPRPRGFGGPPDPATMVQNQVSRLTTLLNLTTDQASPGSLSGQILSIQSKADAAFRAILTPDQQAKLDQLGGFAGGGFGPGPGGRPPRP